SGAQALSRGPDADDPGDERPDRGRPRPPAPREPGGPGPHRPADGHEGRRRDHRRPDRRRGEALGLLQLIATGWARTRPAARLVEGARTARGGRMVRPSGGTRRSTRTVSCATAATPGWPC